MLIAQGATFLDELEAKCIADAAVAIQGTRADLSNTAQALFTVSTVTFFIGHLTEQIILSIFTPFKGVLLSKNGHNVSQYQPATLMSLALLLMLDLKE